MNMQNNPWPDLEPIPRERTADECLFHWQTICRVAKDKWATDFAHSIAKQSRRRGWKPTPKQLAFMRRMVSDLFLYRADDDDDLSLIE